MSLSKWDAVMCTFNFKTDNILRCSGVAQCLSNSVLLSKSIWHWSHLGLRNDFRTLWISPFSWSSMAWFDDMGYQIKDAQDIAESCYVPGKCLSDRSRISHVEVGALSSSSACLSACGLNLVMSDGGRIKPNCDLSSHLVSFILECCLMSSTNFSCSLASSLRTAAWRIPPRWSTKT